MLFKSDPVELLRRATLVNWMRLAERVFVAGHVNSAVTCDSLAATDERSGSDTGRSCYVLTAGQMETETLMQKEITKTTVSHHEEHAFAWGALGNKVFLKATRVVWRQMASSKNMQAFRVTRILCRTMRTATRMAKRSLRKKNSFFSNSRIS